MTAAVESVSTTDGARFVRCSAGLSAARGCSFDIGAEQRGVVRGATSSGSFQVRWRDRNGGDLRSSLAPALVELAATA
jgi:hypothetical protein